MGKITITAKHAGFRRCGVAHSDSPVVWPEDSFTPEQIKQLKAEPMLVVHDGAQVSQGKLEGQIDQLQSDNQLLQEKLASLTAEHEAAQSSVASLTADNAALQKSIDALTVENGTLQKQVTELTAGGKGK